VLETAATKIGDSETTFSKIKVNVTEEQTQQQDL
jgi:hypothetical protein